MYPDSDSSIPDRSCGTNERDDNTEILVREIQAEIFALTGCYAHVIINNLHRSKLDPNREVNEATCGDSDTIDHWNGWHSFIDQASASVEANWGKGLYIDLHGQSHSIARIELGYNISSSELNNSDLNATSIINKSTIKNLVSNNIGGHNHEQLIRGNQSLGAKLKNTTASFYNNNINPGCGVTSGYRAIPSNYDSGASDSCDDTKPNGNSYFDGDFYNNRRHGSGQSAGDGSGGGGSIDGIMSEVNRRVRDLGTYNGNVFDSRPQTLVPFAKDYASVLLDYVDTNYNDFANFSYTSNSYNTADANPIASVTGLNNGVFSGSAGLSINAANGEINLSNSSEGSHTITYTVGSCGYYSTTLTVQITSSQSDITAPIISLVGNTVVDLNVGDTYNEQGATATDNNDGDLTANIVTNGNVDTNTAGTYTINYNVSDAAGNSATEVTRTINVTTTSVTYCDSASTNVNDEYISNVQLNTINNTSGAQFYSDFTAISTTLTKGSQYTITVTPTWTGTVYNEAYSVWIDYNKNGVFTDTGEQVWTQGNTKATPVSGSFTIPSSATESSTRMRVSMKYNSIPSSCESFQYGEVEDYTIIIEGNTPDTTAPTIALVGNAIIELNLGDTYTEEGATATDNIDGNITSSIIIAGNVDTSTEGTYTVTYNVNDTSGNAAIEVTRTINVTIPPDTTAPIISLIGNANLNLTVGDTYNEQGATATDNVDGNLTSNIIISGNVNTTSAGTYTVNYNVSDTAGNAANQISRTVIVNQPDNTIPEITLIGNAVIDLNVGNTYTEQGATATDNIDGNITSSIIIAGNVDTSTEGTYTVTYNVDDASGNAAIEVTRTINVSIPPDTTAPIISLIGNATINLTVGDTYNEQGATATDNVDGNLTSNLVTSGNVDTANAGTYTVNYNVSDAAGNAANQITRTITVTEAATGCDNGINSFPYSEGFENTLGAWTQSAADDIDWTLDANGTPSNGTGPSNATQGSYYAYVEASGNNVGYPTKQAILNSPCFNLSTLTDATFSFKYHMYGDANMGTFNLELSADNGTTWTSIWSKTGNQGNAWQTATINLSSYVGSVIKLRFNRITGNTWKADIAIDDISLIEKTDQVSGCENGISSFPYSESYENTLGEWTQSSADNIDWTVDNNGTPSNGTGPSSAAQGNYYIFVEASGNNVGYPNKQALINSPCYDLTSQSSASFSFSYHMYGDINMGSIALEASNNNGESWTSIWNESGNKGNAWQNTSIDLSAYLGSGLQLRFNRITGNTWKADIAIDNINLTTSSQTVRTNPLTTLTPKSDEMSQSISIYPNPVKGNILNVKLTLNTESNSKTTTFTIVNMVGQTVLSGDFKKVINVERLEAGLYFINVSNNEKTWSKKFIKE